MHAKSISRWITYADMWISNLVKRFYTCGTPIPGRIFTELSPAEQSLFESGVREWARNENPTKITLPGGLATIQGALAGIAHVRGLREAAAAQLQTLMDDNEKNQQQSGANDTCDTRVADSQRDAPENKNERVQAKA